MFYMHTICMCKEISMIEEALRYLSSTNPIMFKGSPGTGKSERIEKWGKERGMRVLIEHPVIAQSVDYKGLPSVVKNEAQWLPIGTLKEIANSEGPNTLVFFDDLGQATQAVQAAIMQIVQARKLGDHVIRDNVLFVLATNRAQDRSGVKSVISALTNRCQIIDVNISSKEWAEWANTQKDIDPVAVAYVNFNTDVFSKKVPEGSLEPFCTPRSYTAMARLSLNGCDSMALLSGWVGKSIAVDFITYKETIAKIPNIQDILTNPKRILKITDPGLLHAVTALASRQCMNCPEKVVNLANTLKSGWGFQLISQSAGFNPAFKKTKEFRQWALAHKDAL